MTVEELLARLDRVKREKAGQWAARCPAHEDNGPSLAVKANGDGKLLLHCHAGCTLAAVLKALRLEESDLFPPKDEKPAAGGIAAQYPYHDERGELLYEVVRMLPKNFRQRRPDGNGGWSWKLGDVRRVLFRLPELMADDAKDRRVFVVEGEKDVETLRGLGFIATCCAGGSNAWHHVAAHAAEVLKGRHVTILPDNDDPGRKYAASVTTSLRGSAASLRVLALPGLAQGGDVSDWVRDGGTAGALIELAKSAPAPNEPMPELIGIDIGTTAQRLDDGERERRLGDADKLIPFGVSFLDDALGGLMPHDLVVVTARAGAGKTQLASTVAELAARNGRRALGLFLEADRGEIELRMKYRALAKVWAEDAPGRVARREQVRQLSYGAWMRGHLRDVFDATTEKAADRWLADTLGPRLRTVYRGSTFTLEDTERVMTAMAEHVDMFVIDHLHYVDVEDETNENRAETAIMKRLRDLTQRMHKPVLLVVHLRKDDARLLSLVPAMRDLHGSSNVAKIATRVVALAPAPREKAGDWNLAPTFMTVLKDRMDGATPLVARVIYDKATGAYRETYDLGLVTRGHDGEEWNRVEQLPWWAERARR